MMCWPAYWLSLIAGKPRQLHMQSGGKLSAAA